MMLGVAVWHAVQRRWPTAAPFIAAAAAFAVLVPSGAQLLASLALTLGQAILVCWLTIRWLRRR
jgi:hypothetical protein